MPGFNNYTGYGSYYNYGSCGNNAAVPSGYVPNQWNQNGPSYMQQPQQQSNNPQNYIYVHGIDGANNFQMPPGVNQLILWDDTQDRFYVKGYDNTGRPRVLADKDFIDHVEPTPQAQQTPQIDLSAYATKEDIRQMISETLKGITLPNMTDYLTRTEFDQAINNLAIGNEGRIVRQQ